MKKVVNRKETYLGSKVDRNKESISSERHREVPSEELKTINVEG